MVIYPFFDGSSFIMNNVIKFFQQNIVQYLATIGCDGKASVDRRRIEWQAMVLYQLYKRDV